MKRVEFLRTASAVSGMTTISPLWLWNKHGIQADQINKVHVIFKTHLDVGFTRLASEVVKIYFDEFIPKALDLADEIRDQSGSDRYIWTTGSWLIWKYLREASPLNQNRMTRAIENGDIVWHALPFTMHSELADASLFKLGLQLAKELDTQFNRKTISAKMTDVPGHTRSIVSPLADAGIQFLHIGVNPASTPPDLPPLCRWQNQNGKSVILMYQKDYGSLMRLPGNQVAVSINFTGDNHGPHRIDQIKAIYKNLHELFPDANIMASTLDQVAFDLIPHQMDLPIIEKELGDTWIHGAGSDPRKMAEFRELSRLRLHWIDQGKWKENSQEDVAFGERLLRVSEHTWGLDVKSHLKHWDIYEPADFEKNRHHQAFIKMEASWDEKRNYNHQAIAELPDFLAAQAQEHLQKLSPKPPVSEDFNEIANPADMLQTRHFSLQFSQENGSIKFLKELQKNKIWNDEHHVFGLLLYQTFSDQDYQRFHHQYLTQRPDWALKDFGKPGIENTHAKSEISPFKLKSIGRKNKSGEDHFRLLLSGEQLTDTGAPPTVLIDYVFYEESPKIGITCSWYNKPAYRLPEAIWMGFNPIISHKARWLLDKMGEPIAPFEVIKDGNRHLHGVQKGISAQDHQAGFEIQSLDACLCAPGDPSLLNFSNDQPDLSKGVHFNLYNNVWGTNFRMWFEGDMEFRFTYSADTGLQPQTKRE